MSDKFRLTLFTIQQLSDFETFRRLWSLLDDPLISPQRYDSVERAKLRYGSDAVEQAAQLYQNHRILFVRGGKDSFLGVFKQQPGNLSTWNFWLDVRAMRGKKAERWLEWFFRLCSELPILYGFGCSEAEYEAKHRYVRVVPGVGTASGAVGVSIAEFYQYLPGLYWLTIFGAELVQAFGQSRLMTLPDVKVFTLGSQQLAICLDEPVLPLNMEQRLKTESELADIIGAKFFFDRNRTDLTFQAVPQLIRKLDEPPPDQV